MIDMEQIAHDIIGPSPIEVGKRYLHPEHGLVEVIEGDWTVNGRLSNFWTWRPVQEDGTLGEPVSGLGGEWELAGDPARRN